MRLSSPGWTPPRRILLSHPLTRRFLSATIDGGGGGRGNSGDDSGSPPPSAHLRRLFHDHELIFRGRSATDLARLYCVLGLCGVRAFAGNAYPVSRVFFSSMSV